MKHTCHATGCETPVAPSLFMCKTHWYMLPYGTRTAIYAEYEPGQEDRKDPSSEYLDVTLDAIKWLEEHEGAT